MKTRVLWVSEASVLNTGYAVYSREILKRLSQQQNLEIAEFAAYLSPDDPRIGEIPWIVYPNLPNSRDQNEVNAYMSEPTNQFGAWKFEAVAHDFMPHVVIGISDFWMQSFICTSPYRPYYKHFWMPTVDAEHQDREWISTYRDVDKIFTYQDWSIDVLRKESNNRIPIIGSTPPCADVAFQPHDNRAAVRKAFGLQDFIIFGTVMRNQRRKLYPALFKAFRQYLDESNNTKALLYCHTSYPDRGWDIPSLLLEYGLSNKVLFTYVCKNCGYAFPSFFSDAVTFCPRCGNPSAVCANVHHGVDNNTLATIYNLFDVYIQYSNCEGFGMPIVEAAACAIPIAAVDYSAMTDILTKLDGYRIGLVSKDPEVETGRLMAIPDNDELIRVFKYFSSLKPQDRINIGFKNRHNCEKHYNWNKTAAKWYSAICEIDPEASTRLWFSEPNIRQIPTQIPNNLTNEQFARYLILHVLQEPKYCNSYMESRLVRDLNYGLTTNHVGGLYFNEMSNLFTSQNQQKAFTRQDAYQIMASMRNKINFWEDARARKVSAMNA